MSRDSIVPAPPDELQCALREAILDYRAEVQRWSLGLAYRHARAQACEPVAPSLVSDHPFAYVIASGLPDAESWSDTLHVLVNSDSARRLCVLGVDVEVMTLAEVRWLGQAGVGPEGGVLRAEGGREAWRVMAALMTGKTSLPLWQRAAELLECHGARLSLAMRQAMAALVRELQDDDARAGVSLDRLAASEHAGDGSFVVSVPALVRGAPGWGVHVRADPTIDGSWMVMVHRIRVAAPAVPDVAPAIVVIVSAQGPDGPREIRQRMAADDEYVTWYEDQTLGHAPVVRAEMEVHV